MSGSNMSKVVFIPGYRENTEPMLNKLKRVRNNPPMKYMTDERFSSLVAYAEEKIEQAKELEREALENPAGKNYVREFYVACCDNARKAIYTGYDEPLARHGDAVQRGRSEAGINTGKEKQAEAQKNIKDVRRRWEKLAKDGRPERERAGIIATQTGKKVNTVREWIRKAGLR